MRYCLTLLFVMHLFLLKGQVEAIPYQSTLADQNGDVLKLVQTEIRVNIIQDNPSGTIMYSEEHATTTGVNGDVSLEIGHGDPLLMTFDNINWEQPNYIELMIKPEGVTTFLSIGKTEMLSVPYALFALKKGCDSGCPGQQGERGFQGPKGNQGERGLQGLLGIDGWDGTNGRNGLDGYQTLELTNVIPTNPVTGEFYLDDGTNRNDGQPGFRYFDGTNWLNL